jgi:hypothetical protein
MDSFESLLNENEAHLNPAEGPQLAVPEVGEVASSGGPRPS